MRRERGYTKSDRTISPLGRYSTPRPVASMLLARPAGYFGSTTSLRMRRSVAPRLVRIVLSARFRRSPRSGVNLSLGGRSSILVALQFLPVRITFAAFATVARLLHDAILPCVAVVGHGSTRGREQEDWYQIDR